MAKVDAIKCPNCGAPVKGTGYVNCPYCGSPLEVSSDDASRLAAARRQFGVSGKIMAPGQPLRFVQLPGLEVTKETRDIPFQPKTILSKLGSKASDPTLRAQSETILQVISQTQSAINREDLPAYLANYSNKNPAFYEEARRGAVQQFAETDLKRLTTVVEFTRLTPTRAVADVTSEVFIFLSTGHVNHLFVTFTNEFERFPDGWKVIAARPKGSGGSGSCGGATLIIIIAAGGVLLGGIVAVIAALKSCGPDGGAVTITETTPATPEPGAKKITIVNPPRVPGKPIANGNYSAKMGIPLYDKPSYDGNVTTVIMPGTDFAVTGRNGEWYHIKAKTGAEGWTPDPVLQSNF